MVQLHYHLKINGLHSYKFSNFYGSDHNFFYIFPEDNEKNGGGNKEGSEVKKNSDSANLLGPSESPEFFGFIGLIVIIVSTIPFFW